MVHVSHTVAPDAAWRLRVEGLTVRRGRSTVLENFSWRHGAGRIAWVTGENGAGKSSLLRTLAGRLAPRAGRVLWVGPSRRPRRLYHHPEMRLPATATVADWRRLVAALLPGDAAAVGPLAPPDAPAHRRLSRLSTGEAKRLLLDALLLSPGPFLFLDEPYEHLSAHARSTLTELLIGRARRSVTVVATNRALPGEARDGPIVRLEAGRAHGGGGIV